MRAHVLRRVIAAGIAAVQVAGVLHVALVRHTTCVEHGELVEAQPSEQRQPAREGCTVDAQVGAVALHEHCAVALHARTPFFVSAGVAQKAPVDQPTAPERPAVAGWAAPLIVAPKQSPPGA